MLNCARAHSPERIRVRTLKRQVVTCVWRLALVGLLIHCVAWTARANNANGENEEREAERIAIEQLTQTNQMLIQEIAELRVRMKEIEAKQAATDAEPSPASAPSAASTPVPVAAAARPAEPPPSDSSIASGVQLHVFGDLGFRATDAKGVSNTFYLGSLDMLMASSLSDRVSVLAEVLFIPQHDNNIGIDLERVLLQYHHNDYFAVGVGRYHTSIGYYNATFHRGEWFQTAIGRPQMYAFAENGGALPLQEVGVTAHGKIPSGMLGLNYVAEMGNGRAHLLYSNPAQNTQDEHNGKSYNIAVFSRPSLVPGLQVGYSFYHDHLTFPDGDNHNESIMTAYVVYRNSTYELLNEGLLVRHDVDLNDPKEKGSTVSFFLTPGFYTQISRKFGSYRPYFRYSYINAPDNEPIYGDPTEGVFIGRQNGPTLGLRYDFTEHSTIKLQYDRLARRGQTTSNGLGTQFSFTF